MRVLVIIVTYNAIRWIDRCLGSVVEWDVYVIDNGSTDGTQQYIKKHFPKVLLTENDENMGFGKANNIGLQYALDENYDYAYLMNQDAWVMPGAINTMIKVMEVHKEYGVATPMQLQADMGHFDWNFGYNICMWEYSHLMLEDWWSYNKKHDDIYEIHFAPAAHWLISRKCLLTIGGFSPVFPHYGEDNNFIDRLLFHNIKLGVVCKALAIHDRENRPASKDRTNYILCYINQLILLSNITAKYVRFRKLKFLMQLMVCFRKVGVFVTIKYLYKIFRQYKEIRRAREMSKRGFAFLDNDK